MIEIGPEMIEIGRKMIEIGRKMVEMGSKMVELDLNGGAMPSTGGSRCWLNTLDLGVFNVVARDCS